MLDISPQNSDALYGKGFAFLHLFNFQAALNTLKQHSRKTLHISNAWLQKGITLTHLDLHEEAIDAFDHALALNPKLTEANVRKSVELIRLHHYEEAVTILNQLQLKNSPVMPGPGVIWA